MVQRYFDVAPWRQPYQRVYGKRRDPDLSQRDPDELLPEAATTHPTQQHRPFIVHGSKNPPKVPLMNRTYFRMFFFVAKVPL